METTSKFLLSESAYQLNVMMTWHWQCHCTGIKRFLDVAIIARDLLGHVLDSARHGLKTAGRHKVFAVPLAAQLLIVHCNTVYRSLAAKRYLVRLMKPRPGPPPTRSNRTEDR
jgi:hypothetical protein